MLESKGVGRPTQIDSVGRERNRKIGQPFLLHTGVIIWDRPYLTQGYVQNTQYLTA